MHSSAHDRWLECVRSTNPVKCACYSSLTTDINPIIMLTKECIVSIRDRSREGGRGREGGGGREASTPGPLRMPIRHSSSSVNLEEPSPHLCCVCQNSRHSRLPAQSMITRSVNQPQLWHSWHCGLQSQADYVEHSLKCQNKNNKLVSCTLLL